MKETESLVDDHYRSLALLVSDAIANTLALNDRQKSIVVEALRRLATRPVTRADEKRFLGLMLNARLWVTPAFDAEKWKAFTG